MTTRSSWGRVAGASSAALLAGVLAFWLTGGRPDAGAAFPGVAPAAVPMASTGTSAAPVPSRATTPTTPTTPTTVAQGTGIPAGIGGHDATPTGAAAAPPDLLEIDRIGLRMPVRPVALAADGGMALPATPDVAGWYEYGPAPGDPRGATVIAGHVDTRAAGAGPMAGLAGLRVGDGVEVRAGPTTRHYRVTSVRSLPKTTLDLAALFDRDGPPRLHLVTCGGNYDRVAHHYEDNVVVVAEPVA